MYDYFIRSYECTEDGTISVPHLLNFLQETASLHAGERGFDFPVIHPETGGVGGTFHQADHRAFTSSLKWRPRTSKLG